MRLACLVVIAVALLLAESLALFPARLCDFRAFYCSGRAVLAGRDPYREHPLTDCEHALPGPLVSDLPPAITVPAPYPGFALGLFALVALLPFNAAVLLWTLASGLALSAAIVKLSRLTRTPLTAGAIVLGFPAAVIPLPLGQPTLFVLLALVLCATALDGGRPRRAALAALVTLLDPHVGIALCAALACGAPATRIVLAGGCLALAAFDLTAFGAAREIEYLRDVLPLHALVNVPEFSQFSVANLAFSAGLARSCALSLGSAWYAGSVVLGAIAGLRLRPRYGAAALVFVPLAFAVVGGNHTHLQQLDLALPAFLLVTSAAAGRRRATLVVVTFVAAVPWLIAAASPPLLAVAVVLGIAFARSMGVARLGNALGAGAGAVLLGLCAAIVGAHAQAVILPPLPAGNPLAEVAWGRFVDASFLPLQPWYVWAKLPTLGAFASLLFVLSTVALRPRAPAGA